MQNLKQERTKKNQYHSLPPPIRMKYLLSGSLSMRVMILEETGMKFCLKMCYREYKSAGAWIGSE